MTDVTLDRYLIFGTAAARAAFTPVPGVGGTGTNLLPIWVDSNAGHATWFWDTGTAAWVAWPATGITQLTGDVTAGPGTGSQAATIANNAVTTAKINNSAVTLAKIANQGDLTLLSNISGGSAAPAANTLTAVVDACIGGTQGNILYRGAANWSALAPGTAGQKLKTGGAAANPSWVDDIATITFVIDGGGSAITTGVKGDLEIPFGCTIVAATLLADQSGSIVVNVWKDTYANYPPTVADKITASAPPTISTATKSQDTTLTGWTTSITAGDTLRFNVDSVTTIQRVTLSLKVKKT